MKYKLQIVIREEAPTKGAARERANQITGRLSRVNIRPASVTITTKEDEDKQQEA